MEFCQKYILNYDTYSSEQQQQLIKYFNQLDDKQKQILSIAYEHLGSSFNVIKSNGFKNYYTPSPFGVFISEAEAEAKRGACIAPVSLATDGIACTSHCDMNIIDNNDSPVYKK